MNTNINPVKFLVRQMNGILVGEVTLNDEGSSLYREANYNDKLNMRIELNIDISKRFKTDCFVSEILN